MRVELAEATVDVDTGEILGRDGRRGALTRTEADVVRLLATHADRAVPRDELLSVVWGWRSSRSTRAVDNTVLRLRKKLERDPDQPVSLVTAHGLGYRLVLHRPPEAPIPSGLLGRDEAHRQLAALFAGGARCVVLHGPGGVGKSTLARAFLASASGRTGFVDAALVAEPAVVAEALGRACGARLDGSTAELTARVRVALAGPGLVVLDGADADVDGWVDAVLPQTGQTRFLVTSRHAPRASGPAVGQRLDPLPIEDAVRLYVRRARAVLPDYASDGEPEGLRALCESLDRLPLAVELAAARVRLLGPAEVGGRWRLALAGGAGSRGLDGVLAASWELLEDGARTLLVQLCALGDGVTVPLLEQVCPDRPELLEDLERLQSASLLRGDAGAFAPWDTVRWWIAETRPTEDLRTASDRRDRWLRRLVWEERVPEREHRVATRWRAHAERVLLDPKASDAAVAVAVIGLSAMLLPGAGRAAMLERGVACAQAGGEAAIEVVLRVRRAARRRQAGDRLGAEEDLDRADLLAEQLDDPRALASVAHARGRHLLKQGSDRAEGFLRRAAELRGPLGDRHGVACALADLGNALRRVGRTDEARAALLEAVSRLRRHEDPQALGAALVSLAAVCNTQRAYADSVGLFEEARRVAEAAGDARNLGLALAGLGNVHLTAGRGEEALGALEEALVLHRAEGQRQSECYALANRASAHEILGRGAAAELDLLAAQALAEELGDRAALGFCHRRLGDLQLADGRGEEASRSYAAAVKAGAPLQAEAVSTGQACALALLGRPQEARAAVAEVRSSPLVALALAHAALTEGRPEAEVLVELCAACGVASFDELLRDPELAARTRSLARRLG